MARRYRASHPRGSNGVAEVHIRLRDQDSAFTTGDSIEGIVEVTSAVDLFSTDLEILFLGTSRASVERITPVARGAAQQEAFHIFLRLSQPNVEDDYPRDGILRAGKTYSFPFVFGVPDRLLPISCKHIVENELVREAHLRLPSTFGDHDLMRQLDLPDDFSPTNASIRYGVYTRLVMLRKQHDETKSFVLATKAHRVRIVATHAAPVSDSISIANDALRQERTIRNKTLSKSGAIVMEIERPPHFHLPAPGAVRRDSISTKASISLRFDPIDTNSQLPALASLVIILDSHTFWASSKRERLPSKTSIRQDTSLAMHSYQNVLSRRSMAGVEWARREPSDEASSDRVPGESNAYRGGAYYTAQILVPLALPPDATFVSTFHSCLISREYELEMRLTIRDGSILSKALELRVPIEMSCERGERSRRPTYAETMREDEAIAAVEDVGNCPGLNAVFSGQRIQRQDSVIGHGHFGVRLDELPVYTR